MLKKLLIVILVLLGLLVTSVTLLQIDDELSADSHELFSAIDREGSDAAFEYLLGIHVSSEIDPADAGKQIMQQWNRLSELEKETFSHHEFLPSLPSPIDEAFCDFSQEPCLDLTISHPKQAQQLLEKHAVILDRYRAFMKFSSYRTAISPHLYEPVPSYVFLVQGNRLQIIETLLNLDNEGVSLIYSNIQALRLMLTDMDNLIGKVVMAKMMEENIALLSDLIARQQDVVQVEGLNAGKLHLSPIPELTVAERSLYMPIAREFVLVANGYKALAKDQYLFAQRALGSRDIEQGSKVPMWFIRAIFKENMSINALCQHFLPIAERSLLSEDEFNHRMSQSTQESPNAQDNSVLSMVRNPIGNLLNDISGSDLNEYIERLHQLNLQIKTFNLQLQNKE